MATPPVPTPERWRRVTQMTAEALERPEGERAAWLAEACADDEVLRREVASLLAADASAQDGSAQALDRLIPLVYRELHTLAARYLSRERSDHTLQPTALVNEAYLKLVGQRAVDWQNRSHFFGIAAQLMRRIIVDHARHDGRFKRGGGVANISIDDADPAAPAAAVDPADAFVLDQALTRLEALDPQQGRIVELRYFGGLTIQETAEVMQLSTGTVKRDWAVARAWLYREITGEVP